MQLTKLRDFVMRLHARVSEWVLAPDDLGSNLSLDSSLAAQLNLKPILQDTYRIIRRHISNSKFPKSHMGTCPIHKSSTASHTLHGNPCQLLLQVLMDDHHLQLSTVQVKISSQRQDIRSLCRSLGKYIAPLCTPTQLHPHPHTHTVTHTPELHTLPLLVGISYS